MKKISKKSLSLVFAALFMMSGNFGLLSNKALADKTLGGPVPSEKPVLGEGEFIGGDGRVYKLVGYVGRGNQTHVFKCLCKDDNKFYVTKLCKDDVGTWLGFEKSFSKVLDLLRASSKNKVYKSEDDTEAPILVPPPAPNKLRNPSHKETTEEKPRDGGTPLVSRKRKLPVEHKKISLDFGDDESTFGSNPDGDSDVLTQEKLSEIFSAGNSEKSSPVCTPMRKSGARIFGDGVGAKVPTDSCVPNTSVSDSGKPDLLDEFLGPNSPFLREFKKQEGDSHESFKVKLNLDDEDNSDDDRNDDDFFRENVEPSLLCPSFDDEKKSDSDMDSSHTKRKKPSPDFEKHEKVKPVDITSVSPAIDEYVLSAVKTQPGGSSPPDLVKVLGSGCPLVEVFYPTTLDKASIPPSVCGRVIKNWLTNLITGLVYLHDRQICHRDVKPSNIFVENGRVYFADVDADFPLCFRGKADHIQLLQRSGRVVLEKSIPVCHVCCQDIDPVILSTTGGSLRLGDFGSARHFNVCVDKCEGTPAYMAPETWFKTLYDPSYADRADIFSLGIIILEMLIPDFDATRSFLADNVDPLHDKTALVKRNKMLLDTIRTKYGHIMSEELMHLFERCLDPNPLHRANAREVREILSSISDETFKRDFENLRRCVC